jgi:hypothetical protein
LGASRELLAAKENPATHKSAMTSNHRVTADLRKAIGVNIGMFLSKRRVDFRI